MEGLSKKKRGFMDRDNSVVMVGGAWGDIRGLNGNGIKNTIKIKLKNMCVIH